MKNPKIIIMLSIALALVCKVTIFYNFATEEEPLSKEYKYIDNIIFENFLPK
nr:hypothetical protein [uncultured Romboutsia sp.]